MLIGVYRHCSWRAENNYPWVGFSIVFSRGQRHGWSRTKLLFSGPRKTRVSTRKKDKGTQNGVLSFFERETLRLLKTERFQLARWRNTKIWKRLAVCSSCPSRRAVPALPTRCSAALLSTLTRQQLSSTTHSQSFCWSLGRFLFRESQNVKCRLSQFNSGETTQQNRVGKCSLTV